MWLTVVHLKDVPVQERPKPLPALRVKNMVFYYQNQIVIKKKNVVKIIHPQLVVFVNSSALSCTPLSGIYEDNGGHRCGLGAGCPAGRTIKCTWFSPPLKTLTPGRLVREEGLPLQKIRVQVEENVRSYQKR